MSNSLSNQLSNYKTEQKVEFRKGNILIKVNKLYHFKI